MVALPLLPFIASAGFLLAGAILATRPPSQAGRIDWSLPEFGSAKQPDTVVLNEIENAEEKAQKKETAKKQSTVCSNCAAPEPPDDDEDNRLEDDKKKVKENKAREEASKRGSELVRKHKNSKIGTGARSGQHGTPYKRAGSELIRESKKFSKKDPFRDAYKKEGNRLIKKGNSINHR